MFQRFLKIKILLFITQFIFMGCKQLNNQDTSDALFSNGPIPMETFMACSVENLEDGNFLLKCPDGTQITLKDGANGVDGADGGSCHVSAIEEGALVYCDDESATVIRHGAAGSSCSVLQTDVGAYISCEDGTTAVVNHGQDGANGYNGSNGHSCTVSETEIGAVISCTDGSMAVVQHGQDGLDGQDASSCTVNPVEGGAFVQCPDGTSSLVKNGTNGVDGQNGADGIDGQDGVDGQDGQDAPMSAYMITEVINPCGEQPLDEVILRFANGDLMAHYSHGSKQHLVLLSPGNYVTTDKYKCYFTVTQERNVVW